MKIIVYGFRSIENSDLKKYFVGYELSYIECPDCVKLLPKMTHYSADGSLEEITAPVPAFHPANVIIIQRSDELAEPDEPKCLFATFDRTREGAEWPGDEFLEKLTPDLPKVKVPKVNKPEVTAKTYTQRRNHLRMKHKQRPPQRDKHYASRRPRPPYKNRTSHHIRPDRNHHHIRPDQNHHHNLSANSNNFDPWLDPTVWWQTGMNTAPRIGTQISHMPHNNVSVQNSFINSHVENPSRPPPTTNRMSAGPSFQPDRFRNQHPVHPDRGFFGPCTGPTQNIDLGGPNNLPGLLGEAPAARYNGKPALLGDFPVHSMHFNQNLAPFSNNISVQANSKVSSATLISRNQENIDDQNSFVSSTNNSSMKKGSYDTGYGRVPMNKFPHYNIGNEFSGHTDDSRNNLIIDADKANYSMFHNSVNHYEDQYRDSYNPLDGKFPNNNYNNKKDISLENSRGSYKNISGRFKRRGVGYYPIRNARGVSRSNSRRNNHTKNRQWAKGQETTNNRQRQTRGDWRRQQK